jgi:hypothetical protein
LILKPQAKTSEIGNGAEMLRGHTASDTRVRTIRERVWGLINAAQQLESFLWTHWVTRIDDGSAVYSIAAVRLSGGGQNAKSGAEVYRINSHVAGWGSHQAGQTCRQHCPGMPRGRKILG